MKKNLIAKALKSLVVLLCALCAAIEAQAVRPTYSTAEVTLNVDPPGVDCAATPGRCFKIHYVTTTADAPATTDSDADGTPDYIESLRDTLVEVYNIEIVNYGWTAPPSDSIAPSNGGDGRLDVYVRTVGCGGIASVTRDGAVSPGSNDFYSFVQFHKDVKACYDGISPSGPGELTSLTQLQVIQDVFAHEYHHAIENAINGNSRAGFKEATANWMNDEAYDSLNVNVRSSILGDFTLFETPTTSLNSTVYGGWFWLRYLSEWSGHQIVKDIWQQLDSTTDSDVAATSTVLAARGNTLKGAWVDFSAKLLAKNNFEEGATWPNVAIANGAMPFNAYPVTSPAGTNINHLARQYYRFNPAAGAAERTLQIAFNGPDAQDSGGIVVMQTADGRRVLRYISLDGSNDGSVIVGGFGAAAPPPDDFARVTSAVLVMSNATAAADTQPFSFCAPNCSVTGGADASITPWGWDWGRVNPLWQTIDVWVDNDGDCMPNAAGRPGCNEPDDTTTPAVDAEPTKGRSNTLFARVRNLGNVQATNVVVSFQYSPFGVGLPANVFANIASSTPVTLAPAGDAGGNDVKVVSVTWNLTDLTFNNGGAWDVPSTPAVETIANFDHFCVKVDITSDADTNGTNNSAQNNFGDIPTTSTGRTGTAFLLGNPLRAEGVAHLILDPPLPIGWSADVSGFPLDRDVRLQPGQLEFVTVTFNAPPGGKPPTRDVVANLTLRINNEPVGGVSVLLARGQPPSGQPPTSGYYCLCDTSVEYDDIRQSIKRLSKSQPSFAQLDDIADKLLKQAEIIRRREEAWRGQSNPSPYVMGALKYLRRQERDTLKAFGKLLRKSLPALAPAERETLLEKFKRLLENHPELRDKFGDLAGAGGGGSGGDTSRLLLLTPDPGMDYGRLDNVAKIYDHYITPTAGVIRQNLLAEVRGSDIKALDSMPLTYRQLDGDTSRRYYYWAYKLDAALPRLKQRGAQVLFTREDKAASLVALNSALRPEDFASLNGAQLFSVERRGVRAQWISPQTYLRLDDILRGPLAQRSARNPLVEEMIGGLSAADCQTFQNQLTGHSPIPVGGSTTTISSRLSSGTQIVTLMNWLVEDLRAAGLDARLDTFFSSAHGRDLQQVVATIPGTDLANQLVLITAHLDAVSGTEGADDNASGVAAVMCAAKRLAGHRFRRTIQFVAFNAEEQGLIGSNEYARRLIESGTFNICGAFNLDMVAFDQDNDRRIQLQTNGTPASDFMTQRVAENVATYGLGLVTVKVTDSEQSSDYAAFWRIGQPAINIGDEYFLCDADCVSPTQRGVEPPTGDFTPCYHLPCDNMSEPHFRFDLLMEVSKTLIATASDVALIQS